MFVYALPISGGGFVAQLAGLQHLSQIGIKPNVCLASSGGNVATYIGAASDWHWASIQRIATSMNQTLFANSWSTIPAISFIIGYFKGSFFDYGTGVYQFLNNIFNKDTIQKYEIWTGTYDKKQQKAQLFCNKSTSSLPIKHIDLNLTQSLTPIYCDGDIGLISKASLASASIPGLVPPQIIDGVSYVDGGVGSASPLTVMQEAILYESKKVGKLHIVYINSVNLNQPPIQSNTVNVIDTWKQAASDLIRSQTVVDRLSAYELLRANSGEIHSVTFKCTYNNLLKIKEIYEHANHSLLEFYPINTYEINITQFNGEDILREITGAYEDCECRFWWIENSKQSKIRHLINLILDVVPNTNK